MRVFINPQKHMRVRLFFCKNKPSIANHSWTPFFSLFSNVCKFASTDVREMFLFVVKMFENIFSPVVDPDFGTASDLAS